MMCRMCDELMFELSAGLELQIYGRVACSKGRKITADKASALQQAKIGGQVNISGHGMVPKTSDKAPHDIPVSVLSSV